MNKIVKFSAIALLSMTTSLMAQKSFQGTSVALTASVVGAEAKGNVVSSDLVATRTLVLLEELVLLQALMLLTQ